MRPLALVFSALTLSCAPRPAAPANHPAQSPEASIWIAPSLGVSAGDIGAALARPFDQPVPVRSAAEPPVLATIGTCHDYLKLRPQGYYALAEDMNATLLVEGGRCLALTKISKMKPGAGDPATALIQQANILERLPPTLGPAASPFMIEKRQEAAAHGTSWRAFQPEASSEVREGVLTVKEPSAVAELTPLASGDIDGDGRQELLVKSYGYGTEGNWVDVRLAVLTFAKDGAGSALRALEIIEP